MKIGMMFIVACVFSAAATPAMSEWRNYGRNADETVFNYDPETITAAGGSMVRVSLQQVYRNCTISDSVLLYELDCSEMKGRILRVRQNFTSPADQQEYGGEIIKQNPPWKPILPDSAEFVLMNKICPSRK